MLSINTHPPTRGRKKGGKGRKPYKLNSKSFTNNSNNNNNFNNKRNNAKYTKPILSYPGLGAGRWHPTSSCWAAPGIPRLASAVGRNWTQECTDQDLDQDGRQRPS